MKCEIKKESLELLSPREKKIFKMRFGMEDGITHTLKEIGQEFGVTGERMRQIVNSGLAKIKNYEESN